MLILDWLDEQPGSSLEMLAIPDIKTFMTLVD